MATPARASIGTRGGMPVSHMHEEGFVSNESDRAVYWRAVWAPRGCSELTSAVRRRRFSEYCGGARLLTDPGYSIVYVPLAFLGFPAALRNLCAIPISPSGRSNGNRITSRMVGEFVSSIVKRSMPMPSPAVGGKP